LPARRAAVVFFVATIARAQAEVAADIVCVLYLSSVRARAFVSHRSFASPSSVSRRAVPSIGRRYRPIHRVARRARPSPRARARPRVARGASSRVIARHRASPIARTACVECGFSVAIARALSIGDARSARSRRPAIARERRSTREVRSTRDRPRREVRRAIERSMRRSTATARATPRETATR